MFSSSGREAEGVRDVPEFMKKYSGATAERGAEKYKSFGIDTPLKYRLSKRIARVLAYEEMFYQIYQEAGSVRDGSFLILLDSIGDDIRFAIRALASSEGEGRAADPYFLSLEREFGKFVRKAKDLGLIDNFYEIKVKSRHINHQLDNWTREIFYPKLLRHPVWGVEVYYTELDKIAKKYGIPTPKRTRELLGEDELDYPERYAKGSSLDAPDEVRSSDPRKFIPSDDAPSEPTFMKYYYGSGTKRSLGFVGRERSHEYNSLEEYRLAKRFAWVEAYQLIRNKIVEQNGGKPSEINDRFGKLFEFIDAKITDSLRYLRECESDRDFDGRKQRDGSEIDPELAQLEHYFPELVRLAKDRGILRSFEHDGVIVDKVKSSNLEPLVHQLERKRIFPRFLERGGTRHSPDNEREEMRERVVETYASLDEAAKAGVPVAVVAEYEIVTKTGAELDEMVHPELRKLTKLHTLSGKRKDPVSYSEPLREMARIATDGKEFTPGKLASLAKPLIFSDGEDRKEEKTTKNNRFKNKKYTEVRNEIYEIVKEKIYDFVRRPEFHKMVVENSSHAQLAGRDAINSFINEDLNQISDKYLGRKLSKEEKEAMATSFKAAAETLGRAVYESDKKFSYLKAIGAAVANAVTIIFVVGYNLTFEQNKGKKWTDFFTFDCFAKHYDPRYDQKKSLKQAVDEELFDAIRHKKLKGLKMMHTDGQTYKVETKSSRRGESIKRK